MAAVFQSAELGAGEWGWQVTAREIRMALALAQSSVDLSSFDDRPLYGFGLPDFEPVTVPIGAVAKCMRWQCQFLFGGWDWDQFNEDRPSYIKRVMISDLSEKDCRSVVMEITSKVLGGE